MSLPHTTPNLAYPHPTVLATEQRYVQRVFVSDANRSKGIYTLKFFKQGQWRYVHVDDRIPCDKKDRPIYGHGQVLWHAHARLLHLIRECSFSPHVRFRSRFSFLKPCQGCGACVGHVRVFLFLKTCRT